MTVQVPKISLLIETERLILEPVTEGHAQTMVNVLNDPKLYSFIPFDPPSLEKLKQRYKRWEARISPEQNEIWLNWVIHLKSTDQYIGDLQVGYKENKEASIAYMIAENWQGQGYATEGLVSLIYMLFDCLDMTCVKAWIDTRNQKSINLVKTMGFQHTDTLIKADHFKDQDSDEFVFELHSRDWPQLCNKPPYSVI